tara:strand:- start:666 stop:1925 length:1260 start_codon:yes stop_codon:yes gene_type:complete
MISKINLDKDINVYTLKINKGTDKNKSYSMNESQALTLYKNGKYLYTRKHWNEDVDAEELAKQLCGPHNLLMNATKDYLLHNINNVYRSPNLTLSRDKLASLKVDCKFNVIRDRDKADMIIISSKTISKMTTGNYRSDINCKKINTILKSYVTQFEDFENINFINHIIETIDLFNDEDMLTIDSNWHQNEENACLDYKIYRKMTDDITDAYDSSRGNGYITFINDNDVFNFLMSNNNKLVLDTHINKLCVEDSVSLTKEDFERLEQLLISNDEDNKNVAQTIMANCNVEESKTVLCLLFAFYSENMKGTKVWNHVNFKYLKKIYIPYVNMTMSSWGGIYDALVKEMCNDKCLNMWSTKYITSKMFESVIQNNCGAFTKESVFSTNVELIQLKDEYKDEFTDIEEILEVREYSGINDLPF